MSVKKEIKMNLEQFYAEVGGNYEDVKKHLMSDGIIKRFLLKFPDDKSFQTLEESLKSGAVEEAFRAAHTLKGLCLNLGFSDLYTPSAALTEILRAKKTDGAAELLETVREKYKAVLDGISKLDA